MKTGRGYDLMERELIARRWLRFPSATIRFLGMVLLALLCSITGANAASNIIVILTDDQEDTGSVSHLPNVRALAEQGVTFNNSFVNFPLCAPSRSSLLTGQAAHNHGVSSNRANKGGGCS